MSACRGGNQQASSINGAPLFLPRLRQEGSENRADPGVPWPIRDQRPSNLTSASVRLVQPTCGLPNESRYGCRLRSSPPLETNRRFSSLGESRNEICHFAPQKD